ncbi:hypothetical protein ACKWTF_005935 [Chironomus riparius]
MSDENIRHKVLKLLKLSSAAFVESYKSNNDEEYAASRSKIYLQEYTNLMTTTEYINLINKSDLIKATNRNANSLLGKRKCAGSFDYSCQNNEINDENVKSLVERLNANSSNTNNVSFEKDFNNILDSIESSVMDVSSNGIEDIQSSNSEGMMNFSLSDPIDLGSNKNENKKVEKARRSSENEKVPVSQASKAFFAPKVDKKVLHNPFKRPKIENDISVFFTQHSQQPNTMQEAIKKAESRANPHTELTESELRKEYELEFYRSRMQEEKQKQEDAAKSKFTNPWKNVKSNNFNDLFESKEDKPNLFSTKSTNKNTSKENCINKNLNAEKQYSTKSNTFKSYINNKKDEEEQNTKPINNNPLSSFRTGHQELEWQKNLQKKIPQRGLSKKRAITNVIEQPQMPNSDIDPLKKRFHCPSFPKANENKKKEQEDSEDVHDDLKGFDKEILKRIEREIVIDSKKVSWDDIIGLEGAKKLIKESVILAIRRPDLFTGLRESSRAIMLFGPPGTGKTLIGKCIASSCDATFMSVSASSLTSKWIGESETLVRAMFTYAKIKQPCVIFFDEIDSLLEKRSEQGNETFNRIKTEFLVQLDGANALKETDKVLLIGATNRPDVIDEAILRRFTKRILVPLPVKQARINMFSHLLSKHCHTLTDSQIDKIADHCEKYSGSDISQVCKEAAMMSIRRLDASTLESMKVDDIPPISPKDFVNALKNVKPTVSQETIVKLDKWNSKFGSSIDASSNNDVDDDFFNDSDEM